MLDCFIAKGGRKRTANARKAAKKETLALNMEGVGFELTVDFRSVFGCCRHVVKLMLVCIYYGRIRFDLSQYECRVVAVRFRFVAVRGESWLDSLSAAVLGTELACMSLSNLAKVPC